MHGDAPRSVLEMQLQILSGTGRVGAARFVTSPATGVITAGQDSTPQPMIFPGSGWALALYAQTVSDTPTANSVDFALTSFRLQFGGTEDLTVDGRGAPDFFPLLAAVGSVSNWTPILRRVERGDVWTVTFRNASPAAGQTPRLVLAYVSDADVAKYGRR